MAKKHDEIVPAKDGLDNTGTQGYDSLSDDAYTGFVKSFEQPSDYKLTDIPLTIKESDIRGEQIIFDLIIKEKLTHVIVITDGLNYHINLDGEDIGRFCKEDDGSIRRFGQTKGANTHYENYFKPIEAKLKEMNKL